MELQKSQFAVRPDQPAIVQPSARRRAGAAVVHPPDQTLRSYPRGLRVLASKPASRTGTLVSPRALVCHIGGGRG